jgi:putative FmdB family regulatory protein
MPIYDYTCRTCGETFDALRKLSDDDRDVECPHCREKNAGRVLSLTAFDARTMKTSCGAPGRPMRFG